MVYFIIGSIFGISLTVSISLIFNYINDYNKYVKPLDTFIETPLSRLTFIQRFNNFFSLKLGEYIIYGNLDKKEITIFIGDKAWLVTTDLNKRRMDYIYNRLCDGFHNDIFVNITKLNENIISNNLMSIDKEGDSVIETYDEVPTVDEILDKISEMGIENLTKQEKDILGGIK